MMSRQLRSLTTGAALSLAASGVTPAGAHKDVVWDAAAGRDPRREALDIEAAVAAALARNTRLGQHRIAVTAGPDGLVTLTGTVATQSLRREVELSCWTVPGVHSLHDNLIVGH